MANRARVVFDSAASSPEALLAAIRSAGYDAVLPRAGSVSSNADAVEVSAEIKALVTLGAGAAAMFLSMPVGDEMGGIDHLLMHAMPGLYALPANPLRWFLLISTGTILVWAGRGIYASAWKSLLRGTTNMNTLVSLGTGVAFAWSAYATRWPAPGRQLYFDAVLLIIGFLLLGKALEVRAKQRALSALDALSRVRPASARRIVNGAQTIVPLDEIEPGDLVLVLPGERIPVDASIVEGRTSVDESMLTGEPTPQPRHMGDRVLAGSLNYDGAVTVRAESTGGATVLAQIQHMVEQAQGSRAPMERLADRASAIFVPVVLGLSLVTFFGWLIAGSAFAFSIANTVAVLVVACPCAMGLAVPAALTVAVGRGAQLGILFKGGEALERLAHLDVIVLDKTGTLTVGRPVLIGIHPVNGFTAIDILRIAAAAEERSNHPLAHAIVDKARAELLVWTSAEDLQVLPGRGLSATIEGRQCLLGNEALFQEFLVTLPAGVGPADPGVTRIWMTLDNVVAGYFDARDELHADSIAAVQALRNLSSGQGKTQGKMRIIMLTGDSTAAAANIARQAGITEVEAGLDPAGKLARIRGLQKEGLRVAMVGDGINDAGALAQADVGIAMGGGADLAQEAGDVILLRAQPSSIAAALNLARATLGIMHENLVWAAAYNVLGIPLAAGLLYPAFHILLSPWLAAAAMALSSVCVLGNSLRLRRWKPPAATHTAR
jgi:P-type Cu+ transporter